MTNRPKLHRFDPLEIVISAVFLVSAVLQFLYPPPPGTAAASIIDQGSLHTYLCMVIGGCALTLIGVGVPYVWGYFLEQVGLVATGGALFAYGAQITALQIELHLFAPSSVSGGILLAGLGMALWWKMVQVKSTVNALKNSPWSDKRL